MNPLLISNYYLKTNFWQFEIGIWRSSSRFESKKYRLAYFFFFTSTNCFCSIGFWLAYQLVSFSFISGFFSLDRWNSLMAEFKNYGHAIRSIGILRIQLTNNQNNNNHLSQRNATAVCHIYGCERWHSKEGRLTSQIQLLFSTWECNQSCHQFHCLYSLWIKRKQIAIYFDYAVYGSNKCAPK